MGTYEDAVNYFVVYPNATVEIIEKNTVLDLGPNEEPKASENLSTVTFNYNDGVTADTENYVKRVYTPNGYMIDGVHYDDGANLVVDNNRTITYSYTDSIAGVEFPANPTRSHYIFTGWYDDPDNGNLVENYDGLNDYIDVTKKANHLTNLNINCYSESNSKYVDGGGYYKTNKRWGFITFNIVVVDKH